MEGEGLDFMRSLLHADLIGMFPEIKITIFIVDLHAGFRFHRNHSVDASIGCRAIGAIALYNLGLIAGYVEDLPILFRLDFDSVSNTLDGLQTCKSTAALVAIID